jgi:hypothetical protein
MPRRSKQMDILPLCASSCRPAEVAFWRQKRTSVLLSEMRTWNPFVGNRHSCHCPGRIDEWEKWKESMSHQQFWFRSTLFEIEPGEDEETNPLCYGRQFSRWLRDRLVSEGRIVEEVIPEDWGWCLVIQRRPYFAKVST